MSKLAISGEYPADWPEIGANAGDFRPPPYQDPDRGEFSRN
jgi:hypothetical protein